LHDAPITMRQHVPTTRHTDWDSGICLLAANRGSNYCSF